MKATLYLFIFLLPFTLSAAQTLTFATHTRAPLSLYLTEVMKVALAPLSIQVNVIEMPGRRVIYQVNNGEIDGDLCRVKNFKQISNDDTQNYLRINEAIVHTDIVMITLANTKIDNVNWERVNQGRVAFLRGSKTIRKNIKEPQRIAVSSNIQALKMVANKRADGAVMFASVAKKLFNDNAELAQQLIIQKQPITSYDQFPYLNKKHALLQAKIEKRLRELKLTGELESIANKYWVLAPKQSNK